MRRHWARAVMTVAASALCITLGQAGAFAPPMMAAPGPTARHRGPRRPTWRPSPAHPLTVLVIGDSLGEDLEYGLADILGGTRDIRLVEAAVGSSGLVEPQYYNWPGHLAADLAADRPGLVVVLLGANDTLSFDQGGRYVAFGSAPWRTDYGARVAHLMAEATRARARVLWVGLPVMARTSVLANRNIETLDALYASEARRHPGVTFVSTWRLFQGVHGGFSEYLDTPSGQRVEVRDADGVHIAPMAGDDLVATYVLRAMDRTYGLRICPRAEDPWTNVAPPGCAGGA